MKPFFLSGLAGVMLFGCSAESPISVQYEESPAAAIDDRPLPPPPPPSQVAQTAQVNRPEVRDRMPVDNSPATKVIMLGTGTPVPTPNRSGSAVAVIVGKSSYLFDFGPGVVRRAAAMSPRFGGPFEALRGKNLKIAFLTHLHSDHTAGLADLLLTGWSGGHRNVPLKVYGPKGVQALVDGTHAAYMDDIRYRVDGLEDTNDRGWRIKVTEIDPGVVYEDDNVKVIAIPVLHGTWAEAFGYRIETDDKVIVISGDLRPSPGFEAELNNVDYLIHEIYCQRGLVENMTPIRQDYHRANHTSTIELAELASRVRPDTLVLTHILPFGCSYAEILEEVHAGYDGEIILAEDLDILR